jgi:hypothetical protein
MELAIPVPFARERSSRRLRALQAEATEPLDRVRTGAVLQAPGKVAVTPQNYSACWEL